MGDEIMGKGDKKQSLASSDYFVGSKFTEKSSFKNFKDIALFKRALTFHRPPILKFFPAGIVDLLKVNNGKQKNV